MKRVIIGMSGGVDSSVAIIILKNLGYEVVGITFLFTEDFDPTDAIETAKKLSIEHHVVDYRKEFKKDVIDKFINDYSNGITPNPCVNCNRVCKFKYLFENMKKYNCDYIATGHYAKITNGKLYKSIDNNKDQSYFLYNLPKEMINKIIFPLEGYTKDNIKEIAKKNNLISADKKESYDVCFINNKFKDYISKKIKNTPGSVINIETNQIIGKHQGLPHYTIGQRKGLNIGGTKDKMYVVGKDIKKNILYICLGEDNDYLYSTECLIDKLNFINEEKVKNCTAKFRYRQTEEPVELEWLENEIVVKYKRKIKSITPGQACVFYNKDECLGGGIIKEVRKNNKKIWYL